MLGMGWLETSNKTSELRLVKPFGGKAAKPTGTFRRVKVIRAMQGMSGERRVALSRYDKHVAGARHLCVPKEAQEGYACHFDACAMEIEPALDFHLSPR